MRILQINTYDIMGGAARIAYNLHTNFRKKGHSVKLLVKVKNSDDSDIIEVNIDAFRNPWASTWNFLAKFIIEKNFPSSLRLVKFFKTIGDIDRLLLDKLGYENFKFPWTKNILNSVPYPDIINLHNLHGFYFDLNAISKFSNLVPTVFTLHDEWSFTGHCACTFDCDNWQKGCKSCKNLNIYPAINRDKSKINFNRKKKIYQTSKLFIVTPSKWLFEKVVNSILKPAIKDAKIIHNGIDIELFTPSVDKKRLRQALNIPINNTILIFCASNAKANPFKDIETIIKAISLLDNTDKITFLILGENKEVTNLPFNSLSIPYQYDTKKTIAYYQASDIYLHAAKSDNFPNTILEAMSCGLPVIATAVGGIAEQVNGLSGFFSQNYTINEATGILVEKSNYKEMAKAINTIIENKNLKETLSLNSRKVCEEKFNLKKQVEQYLNYYELAINEFKK